MGPGSTCRNCGASLDDAAVIEPPRAEAANGGRQTRGQSLTLVVSGGVLFVGAMIGILSMFSLPYVSKFLVGLVGGVALMGATGVWLGLKDLLRL